MRGVKLQRIRRIYQYAAVSTPAEDGDHMYSEGSVIVEASLIDPVISPIPPLNLTEGQKVQILASFSTLLDFEPPAFENVARYMNSETNLLRSDDRLMLFQSLAKPSERRTPPVYYSNALATVKHQLKICYKQYTMSDHAVPLELLMFVPNISAGDINVFLSVFLFVVKLCQLCCNALTFDCLIFLPCLYYVYDVTIIIIITTKCGNCDLRSLDSTPVLLRFNYDTMPSLKSLNLSAAVL